MHAFAISRALRALRRGLGLTVLAAALFIPGTAFAKSTTESGVVMESRHGGDDGAGHDAGDDHPTTGTLPHPGEDDHATTETHENEHPNGDDNGDDHPTTGTPEVHHGGGDDNGGGNNGGVINGGNSGSGNHSGGDDNGGDNHGGQPGGDDHPTTGTTGDNHGGNSGPGGDDHGTTVTHHEDHPTSHTRGPKPQRPEKAAQNEVRWLERTIDIDARGLLLVNGEIAVTTSSEILGLCNALVTSITQQQATLQGFLTTYYGIIYTPGAHAEDEIEHEAGDDHTTVDTIFLDQLISFEHRLQSQGRQARSLRHADVIDFAKGLIAPAQRVIDLARSWLIILEHENDDDN